MCGRYGRRSDKQKIAEAFAVRKSLEQVSFAPGDDIPPGSFQPVVRVDDEGERDIEMMYWGFNFPRQFTVNARSDSILKTPLWKGPFEERRCIVPADYFIEWKRIRKTNNPKYEITVPGREPFGMAGIWSMWKNKAGEYVPTMAVITSEPNEKMSEIHIRQPVILEPRDYQEWLAPADRPPLHLLRILPAEEMNIRPLEAESAQLSLC
jgi:putative SOS response-associated peptidase YedK